MCAKRSDSASSEHGVSAAHHGRHGHSRRTKANALAGAAAMFLLGLALGLLAFWLFVTGGKTDQATSDEPSPHAGDWNIALNQVNQPIELSPWADKLRFENDKGQRTEQWSISFANWGLRNPANHRLYQGSFRKLGTVVFPEHVESSDQSSEAQRSQAQGPGPTGSADSADARQQRVQVRTGDSSAAHQADEPSPEADDDNGDYTRREMVQVDLSDQPKQQAQAQTDQAQQSAESDEAGQERDYSRREMVQVDVQGEPGQRTDANKTSSTQPGEKDETAKAQTDRARQVLTQLLDQIKPKLGPIIASHQTTLGRGAVATINVPAGMLTLHATSAGPGRVQIAYSTVALSRPLTEQDVADYHKAVQEQAGN